MSRTDLTSVSPDTEVDPRSRNKLQTLSKLMSGQVVVKHTDDLALEEVTVVEVDGYGVVHIRAECPLCQAKLKDGAND